MITEMIRRHLDEIWPVPNKEHFTWQLCPIGQVLLSLPYPFGPKLEWCGNAPEKRIRFLWLLPITRRKRLLPIGMALRPWNNGLKSTK